MRTGKIIKWFLVSIILLYFSGLLGYIIYRRNFYQWDFKTFYFAAKAHAAGLNPYSLTSLSQVAKRPIRFRFRYPPQTLWFFRLFSYFKLKTACYLFLAFKCCLLGALFFLWSRIFLQREADIWFYPFSLLAFGTSIFVDIMSGNISILEEFGLWLGFFFLWKRRLFLFSLLIFVTANFKITPLFFLVLLLFMNNRKKYAYLFGTLFSYGLVQVTLYLSSPFYEDFLIFGRQLERGSGNPSSFSLLRDLGAALAHLTGTIMPPIIDVVIYALFASAVVLISWKAVVALKSLPWLNEDEKNRVIIFLGCLVYAAIVPRFISYSHMILIVPAYFALKRFLSGIEGILLFLLTAFEAPGQGAPGLNTVFDFIWIYGSLLTGLGIWILYLYRIFQSKKSGIHFFVQKLSSGTAPSSIS